MPIKNFYTANSVEPEDVFVVTVKVMIQYDGTYKIYRCPWPNAGIGEDGTPQGDRLYGSADKLETMAETLMPVLKSASGICFY